MKKFSDFLNIGKDDQVVERINTHADHLLFKDVLKAKDLEVEYEPRYQSDPVIKMRSKSVDKNKVFTLYIKDIVLTDISTSINVDF